METSNTHKIRKLLLIALILLLLFTLAVIFHFLTISLFLLVSFFVTLSNTLIFLIEMKLGKSFNIVVKIILIVIVFVAFWYILSGIIIFIGAEKTIRWNKILPCLTLFVIFVVFIVGLKKTFLDKQRV